MEMKIVLLVLSSLAVGVCGYVFFQLSQLTRIKGGFDEPLAGETWILKNISRFDSKMDSLTVEIVEVFGDVIRYRLHGHTTLLDAPTFKRVYTKHDAPTNPQES